MRIICTLLFAVFAFTGCAKKAPEIRTAIAMTPQDTSKAAAPDSLNYLALGDSYTIGEAVPTSESFPYQLARQLDSDHIATKNPTIIAVTGWTTDNLIAAIANSGLEGKNYDLVTLLIGVNDQYQGLSQDNYRIKFQQVLNTAIEFAGGNKNRVFVLSIPDYGVTPFAAGRDSIIGPQIDQFNAINKSISVSVGVNYLDITAISRQAATDPSLIAADGLHPSAKMYGLWVEKLSPLVASEVK